MAFTLTQLEALEAAIGSGELVVEYDGKKVEYRSMTELIQARDVVRSELVKSGSLPEESRISYASFSRE